MDANKLKNILEAGLLVAGRTLSLSQLESLFQHDDEKPERKEIRAALDSLKEDYSGRGIELVEVASGFRLQSHESVSDWVANLFQEKTPRYSRALLETLVLIAYRQPITRAEIEEVRGVAVSSNIIKTLQERQWVKVLGHKEVPGRPALLGTTKEFLDYFNLKKLDELPSLADIKDLDQFDELFAEEVSEVNGQDDAANDGGEEGDNANSVSTNGIAAGTVVSSADLVDDEADTDESTDAGRSVSTDNNSKNDDNSRNDAQPEASLKVESDIVLDGEDDENPEADSNPTYHVADDLNSGDVAPDDGEPDHNETLSGPELELLRVISDFSDEHQQEVDARDEMEAGIGSKGNDDANDIADLSQRIGDDGKSGDMPEPGDTLH